MKLLITGSDGFSGSHYCRHACDDGHQVLATDVKNEFMPEGCQIEELDIRNTDACKNICNTFKPDAIIHTARAPGNLWQIEQNRMATYQINVLGTKNLARCAEDLGATFVFLSTDWVFSGDKAVGQKYEEEDEGGPLNYYGVTKWVTEQEIKKLTTKWLIIRPAHIYGVHAAVLDPKTKNKIGLLERSVWAGIWNAIQKGKKVRVPDTMYQTPVHVRHLVETTMHLLEKEMTGLYHLADRDCASRYQIAKTVLEGIGLGGEWVEKGVTEDFAHMQNLPQELQGILPTNTCLNVNKIEKDLGVRLPTFEEGVARLRVELAS